MKTIEMTTDAFLTIVSDAIMIASTKTDAQIVFDGEQLHVEEVICEEFVRGYVIRHKIIDTNPMPLEKEEFMKWMSNKLYIHNNACADYFLNKEGLEIKFIK
jgi:hypothetical protein